MTMPAADTRGEFPREMSLLQAADAALDTDAMLAELNDLVDVDANTTDTDATTETPGEGADGGETTQGGAGDETRSDNSPQAVPPGMIEFEGEMLPVDEVRQLLALNARLKADPEAAQRIAEAVKAPAAPADQAPAVPDFIDPEDRAQVAMWSELQGLKAAEARRSAEIANTAEASRRTVVVDSFRAAVANFKASHPNLSDQDIARVADACGKANIVEGLERSTGSLTLAFERGMEYTMWGDTNLRSLALSDNEGKVTDKATRRKSQSSALTGGGGSVTKDRAAPKTPRSRDELMAAMLADVRSDPQLSS